MQGFWIPASEETIIYQFDFEPPEECFEAGIGDRLQPKSCAASHMQPEPREEKLVFLSLSAVGLLEYSIRIKLLAFYLLHKALAGGDTAV